MQLTRRHAITGLTALLTARALNLQGAEKRTPYKDFCNKEIRAGDGSFRHPNFITPWEPSKEEIDNLDKLIREKYPGEKVENLAFQTAISIIPFDASEKAWEEYCDRQFDIYDACFKLLNVKDKRSRALDVINQETKIELPTDKRIPLYIAFGVYRQSKMATFSIAGKENRRGIGLGNTLGSYAGRKTIMTVEDDKIKVSYQPSSPVLISNMTPTHSYVAGATELLHLALWDDTNRYIEERLNFTPKLSLKSPEYRKAVKDDAIAKEEAIVHAGIQKFLDVTAKSEGFTDDEIKRELDALRRNPIYKDFDKAYKKIGSNVAEDFARLRNNYFLLDKD